MRQNHMHIVWIRIKNDPMNIIAKRDNALNWVYGVWFAFRIGISGIIII